MAKDPREITGSVRIGSELFRAGDEDALADAASPAQIQRLTDKGVISGFGKTKADETDATPPKGKGK